jgi:hypothetical protein
VEELVVTAREPEQLGLQDVCENEPLAPCGKPETENETDWVVPETSVAVYVMVVDEPRMTDLLPPLMREKSKLAVDVDVTARLKVAVLVMPAPVPVTVMA